MTTLEIELRNKLLADINTEALSIKSESVIGVFNRNACEIEKDSKQKTFYK